MTRQPFGPAACVTVFTSIATVVDAPAGMRVCPTLGRRQPQPGFTPVISIASPVGLVSTNVCLQRRPERSSPASCVGCGQCRSPCAAPPAVPPVPGREGVG
ncbi:MAG: hypothetical protein U0736_18310 [Gemmataceae bacterium]